jgi:MerR family transcriptional regulator, copper efflux regulator
MDTASAREPSMFQIGDVAQQVGLSFSTIRHYDELGIVKPSGRSIGGFRLYTSADIDRLIFVKQFKPLGFGLEEVRDLLDAMDRVAEPASPEEARLAADRLDALRAVLEQRCKQRRSELEQGEVTAALLRRMARRARLASRSPDRAR